ncbi:TetR family transcriptional regulator [Streptomyces carminius]|uniref:TetR family transcriptional regulator n=1 Tax=Streptomyces carminius TaxID=2665496 RepID=A0A2M8LW85_9ACTN|nr:TetR/AcrR family transcriptional regulator C-terminal domain-containing protein [Streptomyces carminius]PJE96169.1 TetR family transcriptional regulator [Streptomyces carminius]
MPRPRSLTPTRLATAALAVIDRDGLAGLSMRTVARELGVSTMALYRYVEDREQLEELVVELVLCAVEAEPPPADLPWRERIAILAGRLRDAVAAHPSAVPLTVLHRHTSPGVLRWSETVLAVLTEAGFDGERRVVALRALLGHVVGAIQLEHLGPLAGGGTAAVPELPAADFPHLAAAARDARHVGAGREFTGGLTALLRGLEP